MTEQLAGLIVTVLAAYLAAGVSFGIVFVGWGVSAIDPAAKAMPWSARLLILPGVAALWPLMLVKWLRRKPPPVS